MSHGLLDILRYFFLALVWLFFIYAARMVFVEVRRSSDDRGGNGASQPAGNRTTESRVLRLRVVEPEELAGQIYELTGEATLGRSSACTVPIHGDSYASSVHARVFQEHGEVFVEDLGSTNGTYVNNRKLARPARIRRGDKLKVGRTVLEVAR